MFDRVVIINLKRRPDRLAAFRVQQADKGWHLLEPQVFEAIDGNKVGVPAYYTGGGGAWGCCRSHIAVLERAILDDVESLLVLEDDVTWQSHAWEKLDTFFKAVPADWDQLMLGGQHLQPPERLIPGVDRCKNCQRTHAYAVRGRALNDLLRLWYPCRTHIDHMMGPWQRVWKVYAPDPFVFGQGPGRSDVSGANNPAKFWIGPSGETPVIHLTAPKEIVRRLRGRGLHTGHRREHETDLDVGLVEVVKRNGDDRLRALRQWIVDISWEAASEEGTAPCVWHPKISASEVRAAHSGDTIEILGETVEECTAQLPSSVKLRPNYAASHAIVLRSTREVMEALRGYGWHSGYWRDEVTGEDNGLRKMAARRHGRAEALRNWITVISDEAEVLTGGVPTIWHSSVSAEEVRAALAGRHVVEIEATDVRDAMAKWKKATSAVL